MNVLECLGSGGNHGENKQNQYIETFQKFHPIAMGQILGSSLYRFSQEYEPDDLVVSPDYSNIIERGGEADNDMERSFRKMYNAELLVYVPTPNRSYLAVNAEGVSN